MATTKQKRAVTKLLENNGSVSSAMREAGYSHETAKNPQQLTESIGFKELMAQMGVTDDKLVRVLNEGLEASKHVVMGDKEDSFVDVQPDYAIRHKYLETGLKLKGLQAEGGNSFTFVKVTTDQKDKYGI